MDIIEKYWNAYRFTYMGYWELEVLGMPLNAGEPFIVHKEEVARVLNHFPESERDNLIYERVIHSTYKRKLLNKRLN